MLSCEEVRAELPCVETGEAAAGALRDHLASCEPCRAEAARVRAELEQMRGDLAALAPSPFLEDAVLEAAREPRAEPRGTRGPGVRSATAVGLAAAALLVAVLLLGRGGSDSTTAGDGEFGEPDPGGPTVVSMPPTAGEVDEARKANEGGGVSVVPKGSRGFVHATSDAPGSLDLRIDDGMLPLRSGARHRWVIPVDDLAKKDRMFTLAGVPVVGVATLGRELLTRIGNAKGEPAKDPVEAGLRRLSMRPREARFLNLEIADPTGRGAAAKVRVLVSEMYTGSLVLEEHLGRALGLHHFEIPGRVTLAGDMSIGARRAWARVRIADIGFDETVEVQVLEGGPPGQVKGGENGLGRMIFLGERPDSAHAGDDVDLVYVKGRPFVTATRTLGFNANSQRRAEMGIEARSETRFALSYSEGRHPESLVFLPPADPGARPGPREVRLERVTLPGPFPLGAQAVIARVWRGRAAVPSRESVAQTTVADDGSVSFVRAPGEKGPLRMRLYSKDEETGNESVEWLTFDPDDERIEPLLVEVESGQVTIGTHTIALVAPAPTGNALAADPPALAALVRELQSASRTAGWNGSGVSPLSIRIVCERDARWAAMHAILFAAAQAGITQFQLTFRGESGRGVPFRLPVDAGLDSLEGGLDEEEVREEPIESPQPARRKGRHLVFELRVRREKGVTRFTMPYESGQARSSVQTGDMSVGSRDLKTLEASVAKLAKARAPKRRLQVQVSLREVDLDEIPFAEMRNLIVVLRAAGVDDIQMMMPIPGGR